ncbi:MAG: signal recognition particle-docking protein FtsY [Myxococcota bacterium]|nr:signal recognition particle-docking protein FtsY [Myxococcota bacterium]
MPEWAGYFVLAQVQPSADPMVEYIVYGIIGAILLWAMTRALRSTPDFEGSGPTERPDEAQISERSAEDIEAEARRLFYIPHVTVNDEETTRLPSVRIHQTSVDSTPSTGVPVSDEDRENPDDQPEAIPDTPVPDGEGIPEAGSSTRVEDAGKTLRQGLARTHDGFVKKLGKLFGRAQTIDDDLMGDLEEALFTADIGVRTSQKLVDLIQTELSGKALSDPQQVWAAIKSQIRHILNFDAHPFDVDSAKPFIIMVVGVNGAGKTTTIGKLASRFTKAGKKVILAAGDTFRAAAVEQLEVWGQRAGVPVVKGQSGQDPSSVIFDACQRAEREGYDICIADTAGRLQAKVELMDELRKVHRVIGKAVHGGPHEVWLVLDSTNGQNAISQAKEFASTVDVSGLVLTKLDGTAKGGVVIGICDEMKLPVRFIGIGEQVADLRAFEPTAFADALFGDD